ncbi:MAG: GNAT family N-acetyltransferase [Acidimicrobiales bacterium]
MPVTVEIAREAAPELRDALNRLVPQLTSRPVEVTLQGLAAIISSGSSILFVAREVGAVVGAATLALYRTPTGLKAWIEDVVVDEGARGLGAGEALILAALAEARARGARAVDLTSRPSREAAHRLYQKLGFVTRESAVYRFDLESP